MLVDAPVVAADAINRELAHGQPRHIAAWLGPKRLAHAVFYATLTNVVAFLPLLLVKGKTGDFIYSLPIVVSFSLLAAMIVGSFCVGLVMADLPMSPSRLKLFNWHKWAGITILTLSALRLLWRLTHREFRSDP